MNRLSTFVISFLLTGFFAIIVDSHQVAGNYTSIKTTGGCKLYLKNVKLTKTVMNGAIRKSSERINIGGGSLRSVNGNCANRTGSIELRYEDITDKDGRVVLANLTLVWDLSYSAQSQWWNVISVELSVEGKITGDKLLAANWTGSVLRSVAMGAPKTFSYACSAPDRLTYAEVDGEQKTIYGLQFQNLHLQPFEVTRGRRAGGFTDNVDDCAAFFSAGAWMSILTGLTLLSVLLFGIVMMANMSTVNRFDDPKGKSLIIVERD